jgi:glycosyltransferase involved in cell wall biosynthesis
MPQHLPKRTLLVISDTPLYRGDEGYIAFEPVVRELEVLCSSFDEIVWLGCRVKDKKFAMRKPVNKRIRIVAMPPVHNGRFNFFYIALYYPVFLLYILKHLSSATHVHTRGPSHPALLGIYLSFMNRSRRYWHKYAGNWIAEGTAASYRLQRSLLKKCANAAVTVNGKWKDDPPHIISFENPCLFEKERLDAIAQNDKDFSADLNLLFVGNLTEAKGVPELISSLKDPHFPHRITNVFLVGDGNLYEWVKKEAAEIRGINIHVLGFRNREEINGLYKKCHLIILPSRSEGFPKVIAEAAAYGCIPIVTDVSALSQYIHEGKNGFLLGNNKPATILTTLNHVVNKEDLEEISKNAMGMSMLFTYERFLQRINKEVFRFQSQDVLQEN